MKICSKCLEEKELTEIYKNAVFKDGLEAYCKSCKKAQSANQYNKPLEFIQRGLEACKLAGVSSAYFINRYLEGDKTVPVNDAVAYHSKVLQGKEFNNNWA